MITNQKLFMTFSKKKHHDHPKNMSLYDQKPKTVLLFLSLHFRAAKYHIFYDLIDLFLFL